MRSPRPNSPVQPRPATALVSAIVVNPKLGPHVCADPSATLAAAAQRVGVEHLAIHSGVSGRVIGPWHTNNDNNSRVRFEDWLRNLNGVAAYHLLYNVDSLRALDRLRRGNLTPADMLALASRVRVRQHATRMQPIPAPPSSASPSDPESGRRKGRSTTEGYQWWAQQ
jgi:hypothetical protein